MNTVPVKQGNTYIIINGRLVGPLTSAFTKKDFEALVAYELKKRVSNVAKHIKSILSKFSVEMNTSDVILVASSILTTALSPTLQDPKRNERINTVQFDNYKSSELYFSHGNPNSAPLQFTAAIQPLSDIGQKILSILDVSPFIT
jgi:UDP-glucose:glycoprotein glucosyltransferase